MAQGVVHLIDSDERIRAAQAKALAELHWQVEPYEDLDSFCRETPSLGVLMLRQRSMFLPLNQLMTLFGEAGLWLPVIVYSREPRLDDVVDALKSGAIDYLSLPVAPQRLAGALMRAAREGAARSEALRKRIAARNKIRQLSTRERQVLEWLAEGCSNKAIARHLGISPRTVEIHRATMKEKLGADHPSQVVRMFLDSGLESTVSKQENESKPEEVQEAPVTIDLAQRLRERLKNTDLP